MREANMTAQRDWHSEPEPVDEIRRPKGLHDEAGPFRLTIYTIGGLVILGLVLYGLNQPHPQNEIKADQTAQAPAPMPVQPTGGATTGAAPQGDKPNAQGTSGPQTGAPQ
jgi:hypothetical protein